MEFVFDVTGEFCTSGKERDIVTERPAFPVPNPELVAGNC
jgi:hypothetical protein